MTLKTEDNHTHTGQWWDWPKIKATSLDWTGYEFPSGSGSKFFAFDLWCQSWGLADNMYRRIIIPAKANELYEVFTSQIVLEGQTTTISGRSSLKYSTDQWDGEFLTLKPWQIMEVSSSIYHSGGMIRISYTWGILRPLRNGNSDLNPSNPEYAFINVWDTDMKVNFKYATSGSDRPIIGLLAKIY